MIRDFIFIILILITFAIFSLSKIASNILKVTGIIGVFFAYNTKIFCILTEN
jgi:hypothetical protein